ncbi:hypothetical protein ABG768_015232 [Culter alburnus]|uniref:Uncharacterized protein n=1 Tax=Culter alburnus TaxID=194366 RepID=A0AAW1Z1W7_CULAL
MDNWTYFATYTLMEPKGSKSYRHIYILHDFCFSMALHEPMYIFLCNLCVNGVYGATGFYPKFLQDLILDSYVITYYHSKMNTFSCIILLGFCWTVPFITMFSGVLLTTRLTLCKYHIDKLYCDNWSVVKLSCESTVTNNIYGLVFISLYFCIFVVIIVSYIKLVIACKASLECRRKFWQTCAPHMSSLINFTIALLFDIMYTRYGSSDFPEDLRNFLALEMIIMPPLFNPVIYGLKLKEVRKRILKPCNMMKKA